MLNTPDLANRFTEFDGQVIPIMHLGIAKFERFRAACAAIEDLYKDFCDSELPIVDYLRLYSEEAKKVFAESVPRAAAISTGSTTEDIQTHCRPLEALAIVMSQWLHNMEIVKLQTAFPHPETDDKHKASPNDGNPMAVLERMASAYPWSRNELLEVTGPQVYLMGVSSAWSYENAKDDSDATRSRGGKRSVSSPSRPAKDFKKMSSAEYKRYLASVGMMRSEDGSINETLLGGV